MDENLIKRILVMISVIADWLSISAFLATIVKQDPLLILFMTVAAIALVGVAYLLISAIGIRVALAACIGSLVLVIVAWSLLASSELAPLTVKIIDPQPGGSVTRPYLAKGTVSDPSARVFVIVRTLPVTERWVQQPSIVDGSGNWQTSVYFGDAAIGGEEQYEMIALATSDNFLVTWATGNSLSEGQKLLSLPRKSNKSSLITVTRPK